MIKTSLSKIIEQIKISFRHYRLSYKLVVYTVLCSSLFTLLATSIQLYSDYKRDLNSIRSNFNFRFCLACFSYDSENRLEFGFKIVRHSDWGTK